MGIQQDHRNEWANAACAHPTAEDIMSANLFKYPYDTELFDRPFDLMYPEGEGGKKTQRENYLIRTYCRKCPLILACKRAGKDEPFGIWGGEGEEARQAKRDYYKFFNAAA